MIKQLKEANDILKYELRETEQKVEILQEANKILRITEQKVELLEEANKILREKLRETDTSRKPSLAIDRT